MSGIIGAYQPDGSAVERSTLRRMMARIAHRGPDGQHLWSEGSVGLGHCMRHVTPESCHDMQPRRYDAGAVVLVADARIDNRAELMRQLEIGEPHRVASGAQGLEDRTPEDRTSHGKTSHGKRGVPDSELILRAYQRWGAHCAEHLVGAFAFALWDAAEHRLLCTRDPMGVRPLYYHHGAEGHILVASEIKAILAHAAAHAELNEERLLDLLLRVRTDREATMYRDVRRLPPGHCLVATPSGMAVEPYWTLTPDPSVGASWSDDDYAEGFRERFRAAVCCRTRSAGPVGADLSGGLDSSAVACVARDDLAGSGRSPLHAFSYRFGRAPESDERAYAAAVLNQGGFTPHWLSGDNRGPLSDLDTIYGSVVDDYLVSGMHYMIWASYEAAEEAGVRVMLNGFDGDTTVSHGILRLRELAAGGNWEAFAREVRALVERHRDLDHCQPFEELLGSANALYNTFARPQLQSLAENKQWAQFARSAYALHQYLGVSPLALARQHGRALFLPQAVWRVASSVRERMKAHKGESLHADETTKEPDNGERAPFGLELLRDEVVRRWAFEDRIRKAREERPALGEHATVNQTVRARQQARFNTPSLAEGLEAMNHYGAHFGIEPRMPFMDVRLIRYCLALPSEQSLQDGWTRAVLRQAMTGILPEAVRLRVGKARMWAANRQGLLVANEDLLRCHVHDLGPLEAFVDREYLLRLYTDRDDLNPHDFMLLQRTAVLAAWTKLRFSGYDA